MRGRPLTLCADDYALAEGVDAAVLRLLALGRLSQVSCLVNVPRWPAAAAALQTCRGDAQVGLHLNLSEGAPLSAALARIWPVLPSQKSLLLRALSRRLPRWALADEVRAQIDAFRAGIGAAPQFVDGHQHVHHLPGVREVLLDALRDLRPRPAVRSTAHVAGPGAPLKRLVLELSGGRTLARRLREAGLVHNDQLLGVYDFVDPDYRALMRRWLAQVPERGALLFCHPGTAPAAPGDPIAAARLREGAYLQSGDFGADLRAAGVVLAPLV